MKNSNSFIFSFLLALLFYCSPAFGQPFHSLHEFFPPGSPALLDEAHGRDLIEASNGDIIVGGQIGQTGDHGLLIASFNAAGNLNWAKSIDPFGSTNVKYEVHAIREITNPAAPGYVIVGQAQKPNGNNTGVIVTTDLNGNVIHSERNPQGDDYADVVILNGIVYALGNYNPPGGLPGASELLVTLMEPVSGLTFDLIDESSLRGASGSTRAVAIEATPSGKLLLLGDLYDTVQNKNFVYVSRCNPTTWVIETGQIFKFKTKPPGSPWINHASRPMDMCLTHGGDLMLLCQVIGEDAYNLLEIDENLNVLSDRKDVVSSATMLSARGRNIEAISGNRYLIAGQVERNFTGTGGPYVQKDGFMHIWNAGFTAGTSRDLGQPYYWNVTDNLLSAVEAANGDWIGTGKVIGPAATSEFLRLTRLDATPQPGCDDLAFLTMGGSYSLIVTLPRGPVSRGTSLQLPNGKTTASRSSTFYDECALGASYAPAPKRLDTELSTANTTWLYPNPSQGKVSVSCDLDGQANVYDLHGRLMHTQAMQKGIQQLQLDHLSAGIYMVQLSAGSGYVRTQRLVLTD